MGIFVRDEAVSDAIGHRINGDIGTHWSADVSVGIGNGVFEKYRSGGIGGGVIGKYASGTIHVQNAGGHGRDHGNGPSPRAITFVVRHPTAATAIHHIADKLGIFVRDEAVIDAVGNWVDIDGNCCRQTGSGAAIGDRVVKAHRHHRVRHWIVGKCSGISIER